MTIDKGLYEDRLTRDPWTQLFLKEKKKESSEKMQEKQAIDDVAISARSVVTAQ